MPSRDQPERPRSLRSRQTGPYGARRVALREPHRPRNPRAPDGRVIAPHAGDVRGALGTLSVDETVRRHAESGASDDERVARRTVRAFLVAEAARNVTGID